MKLQKRSTLFVLFAGVSLNVLSLPLSAAALTVPSVAEAAAFDPSSVVVCSPTCILADTTTAPTNQPSTDQNQSSTTDSAAFTGSMPDNPIPGDDGQPTGGGVESDGSSSNVDVAKDFTNDLGGFVDTQIDQQTLKLNPYDYGQVKALADAYNVILADSADGVGNVVVADSTQSKGIFQTAYDALVKPNVAEAATTKNEFSLFAQAPIGADLGGESNSLWHTPGLLSAVGLTEPPNIDSRAIQALNYMTTPVKYGGSGAYNWLNVTNIAKGYQNDLNDSNRDNPNVATDGATVSPCHFGQCIMVSEVGKLKGTTFTYEVDVPQNQANQTLDPNSIDYNQARIVNKQRVADVPVKVSWQTNAGTSGNSPNFLGGSMQSIFSNIGLSQLSQLLTNNGSSCVATAGTLPAQSILSVTQTIGTGCFAAQNPYSTANFNSPSVIVNAAMSGAALVAQAMSGGAAATGTTAAGVPANGIGAGNPAAGTTPQYVMGAALLGNALDNPNVFVNNPQALSQPSQLITVFGQTLVQKELTGWTGRNEFANLNATNANGVATALGLAWLENFSNLGDSGSPLPLGQGQTMAQFATAYPMAFTRLFGDSATENGLSMPGDNSKVDFAKLTAAGSSSSQSLDGLLADIGNDILKKMTGSMTALDSGFSFTLGESDSDAAANTRWNKMVSGDSSVWKEIGAARIAEVSTSEISQQDALCKTLMGQPQLDSTGNSVVDFAGIDNRLSLQTGDFQAIFLNGQGWGVLQRIGLVRYAATLGGQSQALANQSGTSYNASTIINQLTSVASQGNAIVSTIKNGSPSQIVSTIASTLSGLLGGLNQGYYTRVTNSVSSNPTVNPADTTIRAIQGSLGLLAASGVIPQNTMSQIVAVNNLLAQIYSPNVPITNFSSWNGGTALNVGTVMSAANLVSAFVGGQTGSQVMNWTVTAIGLEQLYNVAFSSASNGSLNSGMNTPAAFVNTALQALNAAGYSTGSFNPTSVLINPSKQSVFNFVTNQLTTGTPVAAWANELNTAFNLLTTPGAKLTPQMMTGLITGTSMKAFTMLGANDMTTGLGLAAAMPFISVLTGQNSFETAAKTAFTQTALQSLYGVAGTQFTDNPTVNQALQIVVAGTMGIATDSLVNGKTFLSQNQPGAIAQALGLIPADVQAKQFYDPVGYAAAARRIGTDVQNNPPKYAAQIAANPNVPDGLGDLITGKITGVDLANKYATSIGSDLENNDPASQAREMLGINASQEDLARATQMFQKFSIDPTTGQPVDEAGGVQLANQVALRSYATSLGDGPSMLDPRIAQMTGSLINLGISDIDAQIQGMTGVPNVLGSFYKSKDLSATAERIGWAALTKYVNLPPELTQVMGAFGGSPDNIAKTFSQGRAGAAFGTLAAGQLYTLTKDAGISLAAGDFLAAQFGPSVTQMNVMNAQAKVVVDDTNQQVDSFYKTNPIRKDPTDSTSPVDQEATNAAIASTKAGLASQAQVSQVLVDRWKQNVATRFEYATIDYGATMAIRAASGNSWISMSGMAKTFLDPQSTTTDQAAFLLRTLGSFSPGELGQYIGDATAGYQIYQYVQSVNNSNALSQATPVSGGIEGIPMSLDANGNPLPSSAYTSPNSSAVPTIAFNTLDTQFSKLLGTNIPPGFSQGLFSFAKTGDINGKFGGLPSFQSFLTSNATTFFLGSWLDKETGLPGGTTNKLYQAGQVIYNAQQALDAAEGAQMFQVGLANANNIENSVNSVDAGIAVGDLANATGNIINLLDGPQLLENASSSDIVAALQQTANQAKVGIAQVQLANAIGAGVALVVNLAFAKTFSQIDQSLGLPPGITSSLVSAGVLLAVSYGVAAVTSAAALSAWTAIGALGGPVGLALLGAGLLAAFIMQGSKAKLPPVTKQFTRTFYSASGVAPGFESDGIGGITTSQPATVSGSSVAAVPLTKLTDVPASYITLAQAISAYQKAPVPLANQTLQASKGSVPFTVKDSGGHALSGTVLVVNPKAPAPTTPDPSQQLTKDQVDFLNNNSDRSLSIKIEQMSESSTTSYSALTDNQKKALATPQGSTVPIDANGKVFLPVVQQNEKKDVKLNLTFTLNSVSGNPTATYDGTAVTQTGGTAISVTPLTNTNQADTPAPTTLTVPAYDGGTVTLVGPTLGALATVKSYVPGANSPTSANATSNATGAETTELILPAGGALATSGTTIADPSGNTAIPAGSTTQIVRNNELATQKFTNPMNPVSMPLATATFEANTSEQLAAQLPAVAQFEITKLLGVLLYMADLISGGKQNPGSGSIDEYFWKQTVRPSRIQSFGVSNRFLGTLVIPRYEAQLNRLYGSQADDGQYRDIPDNTTRLGLGTNDNELQQVAVTW